MYGKIFGTIYNGTLYGHWEAIVTFQQFIVLADADGIVDMTPQAICAATSIPREIIEKGISKLSEPDPYSRTPGEDGRRIVCIDEHRPWGWQIVNYLKYRDLKDSDDVREQNRIRAQRYRDKRHAASRCVTQSNAESRHIDIDIDTRKALSGKPDVSPLSKPNGHDKTARSVLTFLNEKTGRRYQPVEANIRPIVARLKDGATEQELRQVVAKKCREWGADEKMAMYLRPATLFNATKFAQYQGELGAPSE